MQQQIFDVTQKEPHLAKIAIVAMLVGSALSYGYDKEMFLKEMSNSWDFYEKQVKK